MAVKRIIANIATENLERAKAFYADILGLRTVMDHGWIMTFAADSSAAPQISIANEGGSGTPVPDLSIEVDDLDEVYQRAVAAGFAIEYGRNASRGAFGASTCAIRLGAYSIF
jgi:catechol 2,3-dioxygenase-like lactoylglutathione lyase family enzyme